MLLEAIVPRGRRRGEAKTRGRPPPPSPPPCPYRTSAEARGATTAGRRTGTVRVEPDPRTPPALRQPGVKDLPPRSRWKPIAGRGACRARRLTGAGLLLARLAASRPSFVIAEKRQCMRTPMLQRNTRKGIVRMIVRANALHIPSTCGAELGAGVTASRALAQRRHTLLPHPCSVRPSITTSTVAG
jgi:hypothetical protein